MSTRSLLSSLFRQKAEADRGLYAALAALEAPACADARHAALRVLNHMHVVDRIWRAHLCGDAHGYAATNTPQTPAPDALRASVEETDRWYIEYTGAIEPARLEEAIAFRFTDGQDGRMSREEILAHVLTHAMYHRGAVGRILDGQSVARPPDGLAGYLHGAEPGRRAHG